MRRDSIFYQLFQQSPQLLFDLLENPPANAPSYRFDSVAVKEPKFEIDGVFLPPESETPGVVYFCEVQFQKDEQLYERLFGELFLYFYRNRNRFDDWQAVVIYPSRSVEQTQTHPYRALLTSEQMHRVYLDELGEIAQLPLGVALMVLTTLQEERAVVEARNLLARSQQELPPQPSRAIIEMLTTIMVYKFAQLSRAEVEAMLGIRLQETRVYQEAKEDEAKLLILRQLTRRVGEVPEAAKEQINSLSLTQLEALAEALLDFSNLSDLEIWLAEQNP
ncbi:Rpn family recombination-promoting nuclease/putative transposase [Desertifilum sp. FACHB-1129]|uniref:DUF4351 domain-containing protein n=2 Tax=Desertifilum tharense IPPAS B-1220 TaxID=1781255 RepID=A0A1E5QDA8_9CYAN|nr:MULTISPECIES: Rpn family recombination-promoting nuclease/putative transposase [Desertifilum]MCD8489085.1 Rpn family recombination-promoting nuclease/putative transposase [Desertifilum sp.]MDA0213693.1 Rpn family recombination-promoting nuclease/putative transposase [Cyanobacteria bacterium FC1]MBD2311303.1 Rpn family recombination-promoting nuclease/putative transposase [Desertifilum sp. FACHB-1129]MBD2321549.1 Rpn family recombination-promoting nuclease/putative transposase [Desertifilum s